MPGNDQAAAIDDGDWERHLVVMRHIVRGRWGHLQEMQLQRHADEDSFCQFVSGQHLTRFVVGRLAADGKTELLPQRWIQTLQAEVTRSQEARVRLKEQLSVVCSALSSAGLDYRVLKGIPFAQRYLGDVNLRRSVDIDLLVHEQEVDRALGMLWGLGFRAPPPDVRITKNGPAIKNRLLHAEHELTLERGRIQIDLHWRFRTAPAYRWRDSDIWAQRDEVCVDGVKYPVLPDEYALVLILVSAAHDIARGGCRLKHLLDVYHLLNCKSVQIAWPEFMERRKTENTLKISVNMLLIVLDVWAENGELPQLRAALAPYAGLQPGGTGEARALELVRSPRGGVENKLWFAQVYGVRWRRDAAWILSRGMPHSGRWPLAFSRIVKYGGSRIRQIAGGFLRRRGKPPGEASEI